MAVWSKQRQTAKDICGWNHILTCITCCFCEFNYDRGSIKICIQEQVLVDRRIIGSPLQTPDYAQHNHCVQVHTSYIVDNQPSVISAHRALLMYPDQQSKSTPRRYQSRESELQCRDPWAVLVGRPAYRDVRRGLRSTGTSWVLRKYICSGKLCVWVVMWCTMGC